MATGCPAAIAEAGDAGERADVLVRSVGTATPRAAGAIAHALDLPNEFVVDTIYRAPARLLAGIDAADAERLAGMLAGLGLDAAAVPVDAGQASPARTRGALLDIAAELIDPARARDVAAALGRFVGCGAETALDLLLTPPGIVLGNVTRPTFEALAAALPAGAVTLTASEPDVAAYALFATGLSPAQLAAIRASLPAGRDPADGSVSCFDLSRAQADAIWRRLRAPESARIVNQDFLAFTIVLTAVPEDAPGAAAALEAIAGVPVDAYADIAALLPCPIVEGLRYGEAPARLAALTAAGFTARADLETFARVALDIRAATADALAAAGLAGAAPCLTPPIPRARAMVMRAKLEAAGAEVFVA